MTQVQMTIIGITGGFIVLAALCVYTFLATCRIQPDSVYRKVVEETDQTVTLECGHSFRVIRHKRESFPCAECALKDVPRG